MTLTKAQIIDKISTSTNSQKTNPLKPSKLYLRSSKRPLRPVRMSWHLTSNSQHETRNCNVQFFGNNGRIS